MKIVTNKKLIRRNARIGQVTSLSALVVLGVGMYVSLKRPELFGLSIGALIVGFILSQVGMFFGNRWGRSPRPDEKLDSGLKGLPGDYTLYHYVTPATHLLVGPAGVWLLMAYYQSGTITYTRGRFRQRGGGFVQGYLRIFGQENIGRPDLESAAEVDAVRRYLHKQTEGELPPIRTALVFLNEKAELQTEGAPFLALPIKKLKDFIRKQAKEQPLAAKDIERLKAVLPQ